jgi:small-conductance mechanosensitive channel
MEAWMNLDAAETHYMIGLAKTFAHIGLVLVLAAIALALSRPLIRRAAAAMREDPEWRPRMLEDLELADFERRADLSVIVRCRFKVLPIEQWNARREFYQRLKRVFDDNGIKIPYSHHTRYPGGTCAARRRPCTFCPWAKAARLSSREPTW